MPTRNAVLTYMLFSSHQRGSSDPNSDEKASLNMTVYKQSKPLPSIAPYTSSSPGGLGRYSINKPPEFEVVLDGINKNNDPVFACQTRAPQSEDPRKWSRWYRGWTIFTVSFATWVVVLYSTSYTTAIPGMVAEFGLQNSTVATLGLTSYLLGLAFGSLMVAPASELFGRQPVYVACMTGFTVLMLPCALSKSIVEIIILRFFGALFGAAMLANSGGTVVDITTDESRAFAMSMWSIAPLNGPATGPLIGGVLAQYLGWRWDTWVPLILACIATLMIVLTLRETYAPSILRRKAARLRYQHQDPRWWSKYDHPKQHPERLGLSNMWGVVATNLVRPLKLSITEPIMWFFNAWIGILYGILYLCIVAYPLVFSQPPASWGPAKSGLTLVGVGIGVTAAILSEPLVRHYIINRQRHHADPITGQSSPEAVGLVMGIGALISVVGQLGFAWTADLAAATTSDNSGHGIHWIVPLGVCAVPFGFGNTLCFVYGANYLAGAYGIYAASALAANTVARSLVGAFLPLAARPLYNTFGTKWAGSFLAGLQLLLVPIPWVFWIWGDRIRHKSKAISQLRIEQSAMKGKREGRA